MGPVEFNAKFQVLDMDTSYNILLGRPFIHMVGAIPSTLHQMMKLIWKDQKMVFHVKGVTQEGRGQLLIHLFIHGGAAKSHRQGFGPTTSYAFCVQDDCQCDAAKWVRARFWIRKESVRNY
ncbi:hypothetical protein EJD97_015313 [Solanum chilense]|uniref:Uncharacterized protein n=1 Tax=Solanum chilense TaxID=4083 RepID=A0A6N2B9Y4_SOLCI|nr:hypothetical protein EJD97_015313 [Solanum chilense]